MATQPQVDFIFNPALTMVSSALIKAPNEGSPEQLACDALFPARYWETLSYAKWPFATKREDTVSEANPTGNDFAFRAQLPGLYDEDNPPDERFVRVAGIVGQAASTDDAPLYWEEGDHIYHNVGTGVGTNFTLQYIAAVRVEKIRGPFLLIIQKSLAAELASKFMRDENMARRLWVEMTAHLRMALQTITPFSDLPGTSLDTIYAVGQPQG